MNVDGMVVGCVGRWLRWSLVALVVGCVGRWLCESWSRKKAQDHRKTLLCETPPEPIFQYRPPSSKKSDFFSNPANGLN
jgi:hypothetical protein